MNLLEESIKEFLQSIEKKDVKALAAAFKACCDIVDSEPHEEGKHI